LRPTQRFDPYLCTPWRVHVVATLRIADHIGRRHDLLRAVRTGAPAYHEVFGRPFWEDLQAHPDIAASFDALMGPAGHGTPDPEVL
jgi:hypothetical protein